MTSSLYTIIARINTYVNRYFKKKCIYTCFFYCFPIGRKNAGSNMGKAAIKSKNRYKMCRNLKFTRQFCEFSAKSSIKSAKIAVFEEINKTSRSPDLATRRAALSGYFYRNLNKNIIPHQRGKSKPLRAARSESEVREPAQICVRSGGSEQQRTPSELRENPPIC